MKLIVVPALEETEEDEEILKPILKEFLDKGNIVYLPYDTYFAYKVECYIKEEIINDDLIEDKFSELQKYNDKIFSHGDDEYLSKSHFNGECKKIKRNGIVEFQDNQDIDLIMFHQADLSNEMFYSDVVVFLRKNGIGRDGSLGGKGATIIEYEKGDSLVEVVTQNKEKILNTPCKNKNKFDLGKSDPRVEVDVLFSDLGGTIYSGKNSDILVSDEEENFKAIKEFVEKGNVLVILDDNTYYYRTEFAPGRRIYDMLDMIDPKFYENIFYNRGSATPITRIRPRKININQQRRKLEYQKWLLENRTNTDRLVNADHIDFPLREDLPFLAPLGSKKEIVITILDYLEFDGYTVNKIYGAGNDLGKDAPMIKGIRELGGEAFLITPSIEDVYRREQEKADFYKMKKIKYIRGPIDESLFPDFYPTLNEFMQDRVLTKETDKPLIKQKTKEV